MNVLLYPNAKINIGLHVINKREDSYHNLETLFFPIQDKSDILEVVDSDSLSVHYYGEKHDWSLEKELCVKAYNLILADFDIPPVEIHLYKNIPSGSGLGGGSSDAAHTIKALDKLFNLNLTSEQMLKYALSIGSDCPFFIYNKPMYGTGRGEILTELNCESINSLWGEDSAYHIRIVTPEFIKVDTAQAYRDIVPRNAMQNKESRALKELLSLPIGSWRDNIINDFEFSVFAKYPQLKRLKEQLYNQGAIYASLSGSGSSLFGIFSK